MTWPQEGSGMFDSRVLETEFLDRPDEDPAWSPVAEETTVTARAEIESLNQRVRSNAICQMQSLRAVSMTSGVCSAGVRMIRCSHFAHARRRANTASQS